MTFVREAPLRYAAVFCVEADSLEALEKAVAYAAKRLEIGKVVYACGPYVCFCHIKLEWDGERLTVMTCLKRAIYSAVELVRQAYSWFGGKTIRIVKCEEHKL
jgi:hypothetical protein